MNRENRGKKDKMPRLCDHMNPNRFKEKKKFFLGVVL